MNLEKAIGTTKHTKHTKIERVTTDKAITFSVNPACPVDTSPFVFFVCFVV